MEGKSETYLLKLLNNVEICLICRSSSFWICIILIHSVCIFESQLLSSCTKCCKRLAIRPRGLHPPKQQTSLQLCEVGRYVMPICSMRQAAMLPNSPMPQTSQSSFNLQILAVLKANAVKQAFQPDKQCRNCFFSKAMPGLQNILRIPQPVLHATVQQECDDCHQLLEHVYHRIS